VKPMMAAAGRSAVVAAVFMLVACRLAAAAPLEPKATPGADDYWHVAGVPLPEAGRWHLRVVAVTAFQTITLENDFEVPSP
jgi:hypothetical protein